MGRFGIYACAGCSDMGTEGRAMGKMRVRLEKHFFVKKKIRKNIFRAIPRSRDALPGWKKAVETFIVREGHVVLRRPE